jgi:type VI secretion system protein ImpH
LAGLPVGADHAPEQECVRFRALPSLGFPAAPVARLRRPTEQSAPEMRVSFLGLTGPSGVLPAHYTTLLIRRLRAKDSSLRDLLDLFNHRLVSLFYRSWEKYRLPFAYEHSRLDRGGRNPERVTQLLFSLVGRGTAGLRGCQEIRDEAFLYYSGHFAHQPRSAIALEQVLGDYFKLPIAVRQFQGQRLRLDADDVTRLPSRQRPRGLNCRLGVDAVLGDHVWDAQGKFRLRIGPLTYPEFCRFFPDGGDLLRPVCHLARSYVGPEFTFDLQLVLKPAEAPGLQLGDKAGVRSRLGWNTWLRSRPLAHEVDDVVFTLAE